MVSNQSTFDQDVASVGNELNKIGQITGIGPQDVIPGDLPTVNEVGEHLIKLGAGFERAGQGIKSIDSGGWTGQAGDAFRANFLDKAPGEWLKAADAISEAGQAILEYQQVLATEKPRAQRAKEELDRSIEISEAAAAKHNAAVEAYNAGGSGPQPSAFVDPGAEARARAQQEIAAAKAAVQAAGERAAKVVMAAAEGAPAAPGPLAQLGANVVDTVQAFGDTAYEIGAGAVEGVVGIGTGLFGLGKAFVYSQPAMQVIDPEGVAEFNKAASTTLQSVVENPWQAAKAMVNVDGWRENPARALGSMVPDVAASITGGGAAATVATRTAKAADNVADVADAAGDIARTTDRLGDAARHAPDNTPPWADLDSVPPPRTPETPSTPQPWDGHEFGPKGSDPLPDPEPPQGPAPEPRSRELPDWFHDETPESWLDDGKGAPEPMPEPVPEPSPPHPPAPYEPPGPATAQVDDAWRGHLDEPNIQNERRAIEDLQRKYGPQGGNGL
ncbi:hypothetical protein OU415_31815 [Saccharopolyspora sp. WRP15-2]|uniref:Putative T7SS secretion signal domain-containing protein n=1 Tax=Saccharopolyspora oryzae TaxID=2997343 RepID=A0ABT4V7V1_9PSEU|nr:hypothetical protein [Saccharopolyspora oryzae]MDA3630052.1 hypothetical protein [Saccharopolyspora oryzae]